MAIPVERADTSRWGGRVTIRRRVLDSTQRIRSLMQMVTGDPNRVAWVAFYTTPGLGSVALPLGITLEQVARAVPADYRPTWVLRANGDYLELDVREDSDMVIRPAWGFWQPSYVSDQTGQQHVEVWEYVRIHGEQVAP